MAELALCEQFIEFLHRSPTPFHAAQNLGQLLASHGFQRLSEYERWSLVPGQSYYYTRSESTIVAFVYGGEAKLEQGLRIVGAHTDSPCLKVKPQPETHCQSYQQLGVEVYGGVLLNPWFDRDLSLAGKVCYVNEAGDLASALVNFDKPIAVIPSLAIHLNREANKNKSVNPQKEMNAILSLGDSAMSFRSLLLSQLHEQGITQAQKVLEYDMSFYDVQKPALIGLNKDFLAGARLDNLLSSFIAIHALCHAGTEETSIVICNDHEEVGSCSEAGAQGTTLSDLLARMFACPEERQVALRHALMLSVDNAHGIHPNYVDRHDANHGPILNCGPVIKFDANQSYATSAPSAAFVKHLAQSEETLPLQSYVTRADMRCGSTIGPLTSSTIGIKTIDIGVPTFAMHSVRELAGVSDVAALSKLLRRFFQKNNVRLT